MQFTYIIFTTVLLLVIVRPAYQDTYSCNPSAQCGCSSSPASMSRIVGGESAALSSWGWAVSISINSMALCGGTILSSTWILTAAHCLWQVPASKVIIYAGSNVVRSGQSRTAYRTYVHPNYVNKSKENDIALIQLSTPLTMSSSVSKICIPSISALTLAVGEWPPVGSNVVTVGWGMLSEDGRLPSNLQQVSLQTISRTAPNCQSVIKNPATQLCAGVSGGGKDACQGDSGGPLMMFTQSQQWELVGLTSSGRGCAESMYAGVYTRVAAFQSWLAATTGHDYSNPTSSNSAKLSSNTLKSRGTNQASPISYLLILFLIVFYLF